MFNFTRAYQAFNWNRMKSVQVTLMLIWDWCKMLNTSILMISKSCVPYPRSTCHIWKSSGNLYILIIWYYGHYTLFWNTLSKYVLLQYLNRSVQQKLRSVIDHQSVSGQSSIRQIDPFNWWSHHMTTERSMYLTVFVVFFVNFTHIYIM